MHAITKVRKTTIYAIFSKNFIAYKNKHKNKKNIITIMKVHGNIYFLFINEKTPQFQENKMGGIYLFVDCSLKLA